MPMYDTLNRGQPDAGTFKRLGRVETLEYTEQLVYVFHVKSDSIVSNEDHHLILFLVLASDFDFGLRARAREFHGIRNQIDERQPQHRAVSIPGGQAANLPDDIAPVRLLPDFGQSFLHQLVQADHRLVGLGAADSGKGQQVVDQVAHPFRRFQDHPHVSLALLIEDRGRAFLQEFRESGHVAKRRAEVVRYGIGKRLQFLIDGLQLGGSFSQFFVERANFLLAAACAR